MSGLGNRFFRRAPSYVKLNDKEREVVAQNKIKISDINKEINRLFAERLDPSGSIRKDLNYKKAMLQRENADIRKGFKSIAEDDPIKELEVKLYGHKL